MGEPRTMRLVVVQHGDEHRRQAWALLFPDDATAFTPAVASFALGDAQRLPRLEPGGRVTVRGQVAPGATDTVVAAGDVVLRPSDRLSGEHLVGYAEARGAPVLVHPDLAGSLSPYAAASHGRRGLTRAHWQPRRWLREHTTAAVVGAVLGVAVVGVTGWALWDPQPDSSFRMRRLWAGLPAVVAAIGVAVHRRRVRVAARDLDADAPRRRLRVRLWWSPDPQGGVGAWVSLYDLDAAADDPPIIGQRIISLEEGARPEPGAVAEVEGRVADGEVVRVHLDGDALEPAGRAVAGVGPAYGDP